jgi:predicted metalloprotease with PDZ domain
MRITLLAGVALGVVTAPVDAQTAYEVRFPNAVHHEAEIAVTFTDLRPGTLELRMSRSSPGRYAIHEFAKNVYSVRVTDERGRELPVSRPNPYQWDVTGHRGTVTVTYTLFADRGGGTYSQVDRTHAHLNMPATFMWARG